MSTGSERAIEYCELVLRENPDDVTARWLLNIAHKTLGRYPQDVPEQFRIAPKRFAVDSDFPQFKNVAPSLGLDTMSLLGGAVADDFDNDGLIDVFVSGWNFTDQLRFFAIEVTERLAIAQRRRDSRASPAAGTSSRRITTMTVISTY